jgi:serine/threonine-protein phosphatase 2A regulatory subunit B''
VDVDGDGRITYQEMKAFYSVQLQRMEWLGHELVPFDDVLAQMLDMLKPSDRERGLVIEDFLVPDRIKITGACLYPQHIATCSPCIFYWYALRALLKWLTNALCVLRVSAGVFFDALFNLNKFIQFEQRDPFGDRQKREDPFDNDWERFAFRDYQQLAMDEEENDG